MRTTLDDNIKFKLIFFSTLGIMSLVIITKSLTIIHAGHRGVIMHFGKVQDKILDEGLHATLPFITSVKKINVRVQKTDIETNVGTKDLQTLSTIITLNWHIEPSEVNKIYQRIGDETQILKTIIEPSITETLKAATPKMTAEEILKRREELKQEIEDSIKKRLIPYGIYIDEISLTQISFSEGYKAAIEAKQIAEQEAKKAEYEAQKATQQAQAEINRAKGQAEAQRLVKQSLTPELLQKQAIEKWDGKFPTVMTGNGALPFINITTTPSTDNN